MQSVFLTWALAVLSSLTALTWLYLWLFHHRFWTTRIPPVDSGTPAANPTADTAAFSAVTSTVTAAPTATSCQTAAAAQATAAAQAVYPATTPIDYPAVLAVVPARNEAEVIARTVHDILLQDYPGALHLVVVNDNSEDSTAELACAAAEQALAGGNLPERRFRLVNGSPLPEGWSGKLWAVEQGIRAGLGTTDSSRSATAPGAVDASRVPTVDASRIPTVDASHAPATPASAIAATQTHPSGTSTATGFQSTAATAQNVLSASVGNVSPTIASAHTPPTATDTPSTTAHTPHTATDTPPTAVSTHTPPTAEDAPPATAENTYVWLTDADIAHRPGVLRELVARALGDNRALVSRMALLCTDTTAERRTIPAFVYFFQMLYPFAAIARSKRTGITGAAGGCVLLERAYLHKMGGIAALKGALIDDCTLAACVAKAGGRLWLELTKDSVSQRGYGDSKGVSDMIARTAYTQLHYSPLLLAGTVLGLLFTFWGPPLLLLISVIGAVASGGFAAGSSTPATPDAASPAMPLVLAIGGSAAAWAIMTGTFVPMLRFYGQNVIRALTLPGIATFYLAATLKSAVRYYQGRTGNWKGRVYRG